MRLEEQVVAWLARKDLEAYLVGGCVRDQLLGRPIYDLDITVAGDGLAVARAVANRFHGVYFPLDEARGTGRAILSKEDRKRLVVDVARMRGSTLAADLADRDFTINALAASVYSPARVIDNHHGLADVEARIIRPVSDASIRDDPVRALRAVRLAAELGFALAPETEALIQRDGAALASIASERIRDEVARLLALPQSSPHLYHLDRLHLLTTIFPALEPLRDLGQPPPHSLDALAHSLETVTCLEWLLSSLGDRSVDSAALAPLLPFAERIGAHLAETLNDVRPRLVAVKLASLLHDLGKAPVKTVDADGRIRFIGHSEQGARQVAAILRRLRLSNPEVMLAVTIVRNHMRPLLLAEQDAVSARAVYRFYRSAGAGGVDTLLLALADHRATYAPPVDMTADSSWARLTALAARMLGDYWERQAQRVTPPQLVDGTDLLRQFGLRPGPQIGDLLEAVREAQASGEVSTRDEALSLVGRMLSAFSLEPKSAQAFRPRNDEASSRS